MDIFKLLSRATKLTGKSSQTGAQTSKLPSAGSTSNPQLYHDPIPEPRGYKRKRNDATQYERALSPVDEEFNFFAPKEDRKSSAKRQAVDEEDEASEEEQRSKEQSGAQQPAKVLDESECRQILRSHRLKVTLLSSGGLQKTASDKRKKSSKKQKAQDDARSKAKEEPKQLYPQPLLAFGELRSAYGISRRLQENLAREGYKIPTEVQIGSLPLLLRPKIAFGASANDTETLLRGSAINLLTVAPTGSGKTLAFLIPVVHSMMQRRRENKPGESHRLEAIVIAPTRELVSQIVNEGHKLTLGTGIKVVKMQKGMKVVETGHEIINSSTDINSSEEDEDGEGEGGKANKSSKVRSQQPTAKADILVTTPLALLNALSSATSDTTATLPTVRHLVLDEADVLLDPLFREQTLGIWDACFNPDLHVTLWSATMGSNIEALASSIIHSRQIRLDLQTPTPIIRLVVGLKDSAIPNISHRLTYTATEPGKLLALRQLLHSSSTTTLRPPFLIFTQTIPRAIALHSELLYDIPPSAGGSSRLAVLHSDLSSTLRSAIMTRFRSGDIWILITTDLLSRGVDFRGINGVVNYDIPNSAAAYIHRVGRTGRAGREGGVAVTFYTKEDIQFVKGIANVIAASERQAGKSSDAAGKLSNEAGGLPEWLLDALPTPSKNSKKKLKMHGVEARRTGLTRGTGPGKGTESGKGKGKGAGRVSMQISTKSGFERRLDNRKKGAIEGSKRRRDLDVNEGGATESSEWSGFDD
jgi:ATP-dependent RNA helicase DDX52/ROK1